MQHLRKQLSDGGKLLYSWFEAMHTRIDIMMWDFLMSHDRMTEIAEMIGRDVIAAEIFGSCFLPDSEVSLLNSTPAGHPFGLSDQLLFILNDCVRYNVVTEGYFDVAASERLHGHMLSEKLLVDSETSTAVRLFDEVRINLSGYLKGYALDRAVAMARQDGIENALFSFGTSSVYAIGNHPGGKGWPVSALADGKEYILEDKCLTTSGNETQDRKHIIDPWTGRLVEGKGSFSIVTSSAAEGEALSTAGFIRMEK